MERFDRVARVAGWLMALVVVGSSALAGGAAPAGVGERIGEGIYRFWRDQAARDAAAPSVALVADFPSLGPVPGDFDLVPMFDQFVPQAWVTGPPGTDFYGMGMVAQPLRLNGVRIGMLTTDAFGYQPGDELLYQAHAWVLGVRPDGTAFGVLGDTTRTGSVSADRTFADAAEISLVAGELPVIVIDRGSPRAVLEGLAELTGRPFFPPRWAVGYHQSRYGYEDEAEFLDLASQFRTRGIPCDTLWFDITYQDGNRPFTWDSGLFPDPAGLNAVLESQGFKSIAIVDPHIPFEPGYGPYDTGDPLDMWIKDTDGVTDYVGSAWPGATVWPDFTRSDARGWWGELSGDFARAHGLDGIWNDLNEPTDFSGGSGQRLPLDTVQRPDASIGATASHEVYRNVYGLLNARATFEGLAAEFPDRRPFVLSRSNSMGGQRYAAAWTGDNTASEAHLDLSIPMTLNLGLSGQPFAGPDIGGFVGNGDSRMFARWMGFGSLLPFARGHTAINTIRKEPWAFGPDVEASARRAISRRYRLLPYYYTLFREAHETGVPVVRPVFFADPADASLRSIDDAFLIGDAVVVSVDTELASACEGAASPAPSPVGGYRFGFRETDGANAAWDLGDRELPDLYLREGFIVPTGPLVMNGQEPLDELTLLVALDGQGSASGVLYEDAGDGFAHEGGDYLRTTYEAERVGDTVTVRVASEEGSRARMARPVTVRLLLGDGVEVTGSGVDGQDVVVQIPDELPGSVIPDAPVVPAEAVDGCGIPATFGMGELRATQANPTNGGDNFNELNQMFARGTREGLRIGITGNMSPDGTGVALLIDAGPGGQNTLDLSGFGSIPAGLAGLSGTTFDAAFEPERMYFLNGFGGTLFVDRVTLPMGAPATKTFLGQTGVGTGRSYLYSGVNPNGVRMVLDNTNTAGVTGSGAGGAATAERGLEIVIPWSDLGVLPSCETVRVLAFTVFLNGQPGNQWLPALPAGTVSVPMSPDLNTFAGDQFAEVGVPARGDVDGNGVVDVNDITVLVRGLGGGDLSLDVDGDGAVTVNDITGLVMELGLQCGGGV